MLLCPLMTWVVDPTVGLARAFLFGTVLATFVNNAIKDLLDLPRPPAKYHVDPPAHGEPGGIYEQVSFLYPLRPRAPLSSVRLDHPLVFLIPFFFIYCFSLLSWWRKPWCEAGCNCPKHERGSQLRLPSTVCLA